jgi:hypothetical protein
VPTLFLGKSALAAANDVPPSAKNNANSPDVHSLRAPVGFSGSFSCTTTTGWIVHPDL